MHKLLLTAAFVIHLPVARAERILTRRSDGLEIARQVIVDDDVPDAGGLSQSRIVYLNRRGITLMPGGNDSRTDHSWFVSAPVTIAAWDASASLWAQTLACVRKMFAPFDLTITETDPQNEPHIEAVFGGSPDQLGFGSHVAGVAPFSTNCRTVENAIVITFADAIPQVAQIACEVMSQEIAHTFGLDHELLAPDPMTYLPSTGTRSFQDQLADCGESIARPCGLPDRPSCRARQNSVELLLDRVGAVAAGDGVPPRVSITSPPNAATVAPGFEVAAAISDDGPIRLVTLSLDGIVVQSLTAEPWTFVTAPDLPPGSYRVTVEATDGPNDASASIDVWVQSAPGPTWGCSATSPRSTALLCLMVVALVWLLPRKQSRAWNRPTADGLAMEPPSAPLALGGV
jgi:hypothetical protein